VDEVNILIIQERGRHDANRDFREAQSMKRALNQLGHSAVVWGLGYKTWPLADCLKGADFILLMEQYDQTGWVPDLSTFKGPRVFWTIDSHCNLAEHQAQVRRQKITHLLSSTESYLAAYEAPYKVWFPNCYDDTLIHPMAGVEKVYEVGFCGNDNGRLAWLQAIERRFKSTVIPRADVFVIGQAMVRAINSYRIHFNRNIADDINYRTFETPGCGTFLLTNHTPGLERLFDIGKDLVTYDSIDDLMGKVRHYLEHPWDREVIAAAGYARVKRDHTYLKRAEQLCSLIEST
jgi:hypothetical protein